MLPTQRIKSFNQWENILLTDMKALRFMGYYRNQQTAATELTQEQYSTLTTEHRALRG